MVRTRTRDFQKALNQREAAEYLRLSSRTLRNLEAKGSGPPSKRYGKRIVRYLPEDLDAWVKG